MKAMFSLEVHLELVYTMAVSDPREDGLSMPSPPESADTLPTWKFNNETVLDLFLCAGIWAHGIPHVCKQSHDTKPRVASLANFCE